ncbi:MAG: hypothetical protein GX410_02945 [Elusimicrobia bacterium]|nr:hypothetical protein [Elusimicrobiota bacterium]
MRSLLRRLFYVAALHAAFYACYPDTGGLIKLYAWFSLIGWGLLVIVLNLALPSLQKLRFLAFLYDILLLSAISFVLAISMPQADKVSVLQKLRSGDYPTWKQFRGGTKQLGTGLKDTAGELQRTSKELKNQVEQLRNEKDALPGAKK